MTHLNQLAKVLPQKLQGINLEEAVDDLLTVDLVEVVLHSAVHLGVAVVMGVHQQEMRQVLEVDRREKAINGVDDTVEIGANALDVPGKIAVVIQYFRNVLDLIPHQLGRVVQHLSGLHPFGFLLFEPASNSPFVELYAKDAI